MEKFNTHAELDAYNNNLVETNACLVGDKTVVAHELIHQYDYLYGSGSIMMPLEKQMSLAGLHVNNPYDVHGKVFKYHMNRINNEYDLNVELSYDEANMKSIKHDPIPIIDNSSLNENASQKEEYMELAEQLSKCFVNDGSVSIEVTDDGVSTWTI